jgi:hypothetical protein
VIGPICRKGIINSIQEYTRSLVASLNAAAARSILLSSAMMERDSEHGTHGQVRTSA